MRRFLTTGILLTALSSTTAPAHADTPVSLRGFIQPELRFGIDPHNAAPFASGIPDARAELSVAPADSVEGMAVGEVDLRFGAAQTTLVVDPVLRELWVRWTPGRIRLSAGQMIVRWGVIDEFGVANFLNPEQLSDLTQDQINRKIGVWSVAIAGDWEWLRAEVVLQPVWAGAEIDRNSSFATGATPRPVDRALKPFIDRTLADLEARGIDPGAAASTTEVAQLRASLENPVMETPVADAKNVLPAARLTFSAPFGDLGLSGAWLFDQIGSMRVVSEPNGLPRLHISYPRVLAVSADLAVPIQKWTLQAEALYLHTDDAGGTNPLVRNPSLQLATEVRWQVHDQVALRLGAQDERIFKARGTERDDELSLPAPLGSPLMLLDHTLGHLVVTGNWGAYFSQASLSWLFSPDFTGHFLNAQVDLGLLDALRLVAGVQYFASSNRKGIGRLDNKDHVYAGLKVEF